MGSAEQSEHGSQSRGLAEIECSEHDGVRVVAVAGEVDISNVGTLETATFDLPNAGLGIVLDLGSATYIDSATVGLLFKLHRSLQRRGQALRVICPTGSSPRRVLEITAFSQELMCEAGRDEAIAAIRRELAVHE